MKNYGLKKYNLIINNDDYMVRDHRIGDTRAVAGVTYLDTLYRYLISKQFPMESIEIRNLIFMQPVTVYAGISAKVTVEFTQKRDSYQAVATKYTMVDGEIQEDSAETVFKCEIYEKSEPLKHIDIDKLINEADQTLDLEKAYGLAREGGIYHYEFMKLTGKGYVGDDYVLVETHFSDLAKAHKEYFALHPAYIDGATVSSGLVAYSKFMEETHATAKFLPLFVGKFRAFDKIKDDTCYMYISKHSMTHAAGDIMYSSIEIYNSQGTLLGYYDRFATKRIREENEEEISLVPADADNKLSGGSDQTKGQAGIEAKTTSFLFDAVSKLADIKYEKEVLDTNFYDMGLDSNNLILLVNSIEEKLGNSLYPTLLFEYNTINSLAGYLCENFLEDLETALGNKASPGKDESDETIAEVRREAPSIKDMLLDSISKLMGTDKKDIDINGNFYDLGLDSQALIGLAEKLETELETDLYPTLLFEYNTVQSLADYLDENYTSKPSTDNVIAAQPKIEPKQDTPKEVKEEGLSDCYYVCNWKPVDSGSALKNTAKGTAKDKKALIIYNEESSEIYNEIKMQLQNCDIYSLNIGCDNIVALGSEWRVKQGSTAQIKALLQSMKTVDTVYFITGIISNNEEAPDTTDYFRKTQETGIKTLFRLFKALQSTGLIYKLKEMKLITNNVYRVSEEEKILPYFSAMHGFMRSASKEYPRTSFSVYDIDLMTEEGKESAKKTIPLVVNNDVRLTDEIVLRKGRTYIREPQRVLLGDGDSTRFRKNGVYLIIGGSGGIGTELSKYLAKTFNASIVWIGRSKLNKNKEKAMAEIQALGGKVLYLQADISDVASMEGAIKEIYDEFGALNGIVHSALVLKDMMLEKMTENNLTSVLSPKTDGSVVLYQAIKNLKLDFLVFFSSIQTLLGNVGQSNYAAASAFEDAFASYAEERLPFEVKTINWGYWGEVGVASTEEDNARMKNAGVIPVTIEAGMKTFERFMSSPMRQIYTINFRKDVLESFGINTDLKTKAVEKESRGSHKPEGSTNKIRFINIEENYPSDNFVNYWSNLKKGVSSNLKVNLEREYLKASVDNKARLLHMMVQTKTAKEIEVVMCGRGETLLLINGFGLTQSQWYHQIRELSERYRLISINIPGVGLSVGNCEVDFKTLSKIFMEVLDELGIDEKINVIGSSFGGMVAQSIAAEYPDRVNSLILACSSSFIQIDFEKSPIKERMHEDLKNSKNEKDIELLFNCEFTNAEVTRYLQYNMEGFTAKAFISGIKCPTLIINGSLDTIFGEADYQELHRLIGTSRRITIEGAGHIPNMTHYKEFNRIVSEFISK